MPLMLSINSLKLMPLVVARAISKNNVELVPGSMAEKQGEKLTIYPVYPTGSFKELEMY